VKSAKVSSECPKTLCVHVDNNDFRCFYILHLDEVTGRLSVSFSIPMVDNFQKIVAVSKSHLFVSGRSCVGVHAYSLHTGELERVIRCFDSDSGSASFEVSGVICPQRNELILAVSERGKIAVKSFCLREPSI